MAITFHKDSTVSLGSFIQVLATGRPIGRIFHVNNIYRSRPATRPRAVKRTCKTRTTSRHSKTRSLPGIAPMAGGRDGSCCRTLFDPRYSTFSK